jgi:hypothetical protein
MSLLAGTGQPVIRAQSVETTPANFELISSLRGGQLRLSKSLQDVADEGRRMAVEQLLVLFRSKGSDGSAQLANQIAAHPTLRSPSMESALNVNN